jgi:hypothetical protein
MAEVAREIASALSVQRHDRQQHIVQVPCAEILLRLLCESCYEGLAQPWPHQSNESSSVRDTEGWK